MGFFRKKQSLSSPVDTHDMVDAKIHVMQHDLDEIAKTGRLEIAPSEKSEPGVSSSEEVVSTPRLSTDGPFSHPVFPSSDAPLPEVTSVTASPASPTPSQSTLPEKISPEPPFESSIVPPSPAPFSEKPRTSSFEEAASNPIPASPGEDRRVDHPPIRTGAWPEPPGIGKKKSSGGARLATASPPKKFPIRKPNLDKKVLPENIILKDRWGWKQMLAVLCILALFSGGFYFFRTTRLPEIDLSDVSFPDIEINPSAEEIRSEPEPIPESEANLPFSLSKPNVFLIDVETQSVSTLRETLLGYGKVLAESSISAPVPFSVVDKNNTPIAFFMFASVFNLGLSGELLNSLDNDFILWLFLDAGSPRLVLSVRIKNADDVVKQFSISEKTLPISLKNLFLTEEGILQPLEAEFGDGLYRGVPIRYRNFQSDQSLSLDYGIVDTDMILGTSKDASRAVIDVFLDEKK